LGEHESSSGDSGFWQGMHVAIDGRNARKEFRGLDDVVRTACADRETRRMMFRVSPQIVTGV
jgi:hypothetical protein